MTTSTILVVEDDTAVAQLYVQFLEPEYHVITTETAAAAISLLREQAARTESHQPIDAVLLDRRLPDAPGSDVLDVITAEGLDCRVAMVTGVKPGFDILDMGFDLYILKPVTRTELLEAVETLFVRSEYGGLLREAASLVSKRALLESQKSEAELDASEEYRELLDRMAALDEEILAVAGSLSSDDYRVMFRDLGNA